ncbi:MAG: hypothetical protein OWU33_02905 [Firmicutes bacterium]|nr:hypothetical protein [Bacillota bacterium]
MKLPKIGWVRSREVLRFPGKILGARVVREADHWFLAVPVSVPDAFYYRTHGAWKAWMSACRRLPTGEKIGGLYVA